MSTPVTITAVGAGRMGRGIAITFSLAGLAIQLLDLKERSAVESEHYAREMQDDVRATLELLHDIGLIGKSQIDAALVLIGFRHLDQAREVLIDSDIIFEGVPETLEAKSAALALISDYARIDAIIASTTSTMLSNDLQGFVHGPQRFLNAHWLNPAYLVPLVEVSPASGTDAAVVQAMKSLLESIGKVPVICAASPGYIVPRIQALAMNEAARMVEEGVASVDDIDKATRYGLGFRFAILGVLEFIDWGGGDILYYASEYMRNAMDDDRFAAPEIIKRHVKEGRIGLRERKGFLDYSNMDVGTYQKERLCEFVGLLRHFDRLPVIASSTPVGKGPEPTESAEQLVRQYLEAMEQRQLENARHFLSPGFTMTFPGGVTFSELEELIVWANGRYQWVKKHYERFDVSASQDLSTVYCFGTLHGCWTDGSTFDGVRFVDRFEVRQRQIVSQLVWNDLAEHRV